jgi:steroid delta-isomerase-like uncharacterized protein
MSNSVRTIADRWVQLISGLGATEADAAQLFTGSLIHKDVPASVQTHGLAEYWRFHEQSRQVFPDFEVTVKETVSDGHSIAITWSATGTQKGDLADLAATERPIAIEGATILQLDGDQIARCSDYYDGGDAPTREDHSHNGFGSPSPGR